MGRPGDRLNPREQAGYLAGPPSEAQSSGFGVIIKLQVVRL